ncbi:unannotated protein [freshwater metagenome]|uniref:Unannotated protein n=1 Tax=freshwater metagenome TaxID=449393 RepID=A0A6J7IWE5_9ZZZZ
MSAVSNSVGATRVVLSEIFEYETILSSGVTAPTLTTKGSQAGCEIPVNCPPFPVAATGITPKARMATNR